MLRGCIKVTCIVTESCNHFRPPVDWTTTRSLASKAKDNPAVMASPNEDREEEVCSVHSLTDDLVTLTVADSEGGYIGLPFSPTVSARSTLIITQGWTRTMCCLCLGDSLIIRLSVAQIVLLSLNSGENSPPLCCVCQDVAMNPVKLPCSHIFCYLCVKGVAVRSGMCALCRQRIPSTYLDRPNVLNTGSLQMKLCSETSTDHYHWFYEARNGGWWMYDDRTSAEIERGYTEDLKSIKVHISGFCYVIDFEMMVQFREGIPNRQRKIKRDKASGVPIKGVAGIFMGSSQLVTGVEQKRDQD